MLFKNMLLSLPYAGSEATWLYKSKRNKLVSNAASLCNCIIVSVKRTCLVCPPSGSAGYSVQAKNQQCVTVTR